MTRPSAQPKCIGSALPVGLHKELAARVEKDKVVAHRFVHPRPQKGDL